MAEVKKREVCDGHMLKWLVAAGTAWLQQHHKQINEMNVFPVPDGDTGTNMLLTMQKAYEEIAREDEYHAGKVADRMAQGALRGARGNSGTILSMLLRGFANSVREHELINTTAFAKAMQDASDYAYTTVRKVMEPVEGTILTVSRESAEALTAFNGDADDLNEMMRVLVKAAKESVQRTPELLPKLREAGVVDSGGLGLAYILEGMERLVEGKAVTLADAEAVIVEDIEQETDWERALIPEDEEGYGYDVQFLMIGEQMDVDQVRQDISNMGWSPLVDGDSRLIKVHVHVHNPGKPLSYAIESGAEIDDIVVENMQLQYQEYVAERNRRQTQESHIVVDGIAVVTVGRGEGINTLFKQYKAARIIVGGQTMNPSIEDFLDAIDSLPNEEIILLPNNGNIIMTAEQAATLAQDKTVHVVPSKTIPQGIMALLAYGDLNGKFQLDEVVHGMTDALSQVLSGEITLATRTVEFDGVQVQEGQLIGLLDGQIVTTHTDLDQIVQQLLNKADLDDYELVTLYYGESVPAAQAEKLKNELAEAFDELEFEIVPGGQPLYPYILSIE